MKKIRVLFDGTAMHSQEGGVGYVVHSILKELVKDPDIEVVVYTRKGVKQVDTGSENSTVKFIELPLKYPFFGFKRYICEFFVLQYLLWKYRPDVLHLTSGFGNGLTPRPKKTKVVVTVHDLIPLTKYWELMSTFDRFFYKLQMKSTVQKANKVVSISQFTARDITSYFPFVKNVVIIPNGIVDTPLTDNTEWSNEAKKLGIVDKYILYVGGFSPRKNVFKLVQSFGDLIASHEIKHQLVIAGKFAKEKDLNNNIEQIKKYIESNNLSANVVILGFLEAKQKDLLYQNADIFIYPSLYEGFGLPILEAFRAETPVLTSKNTVMEEIALDYAGYIDPNDSNDIKKNIIIVLEQYSTYKKRALQAKAKLLPMYDWKIIGKKYLELYRNL